MKKDKVLILVNIIWTAIYIFIVYFLTFAMRYSSFGRAIDMLILTNSVNINYLFVSYMIMCAIFLIFKSIFKNNFTSNLASTIFVVIITLISYYKNNVLQNPFVPTDIQLIGNATDIAKFGLTLPSLNIILCLIILAVILLLQLLIEKKLQIKYKIENWKKELYRIPLLIIGIIIIFVFCIDTERFEKFNIENNLGNLYAWAGANTVFFMHLGDFYFEKPENYSMENIQKIKEENTNYSNLDNSNAKNSNVILIMNEAFSDPTQLKDVEFSLDPLSDIRKLANEDKNCKIGNLITPVFGGGTSLPEFEVLTGLTSYYLEKEIYPYTSYIQDDMNSIVRVFKNNNYSTVGIHTNTKTFYNRDIVYNFLGFENTVFAEDIENPEYKGNHISDNEFANQVIKQFEKHKGKKFIFGVTMQNHMPYTGKIYDEHNINVTANNLNSNELEQLTNYIQGVYDSNKMYYKLVEYLKQTEEPTILIMFGDHLPSLANYKLYSGYTKVKYHQTPYIIWANYDIELNNINKYISAGNLGINTLELSGIKTPWYLTEFKKLYNEYPVITNTNIIDKTGRIVEEITQEHQTLKNRCEILQYDLLIKKKYILIEE